MSTTSTIPSQIPTKFPKVELGVDGKPCKVCTGFKSWSTVQKKKISTATTPTAFVAATASATLTNLPSATFPKTCPPDIERLGRHTWTFLHTTASYYPLVPSPQQKTSMLSLINSLPILYPCSHCAGDFDSYINKNPAKEAVESRENLELWMCKAHNDVNEKLGKDDFNCNDAGERWRDGPKDGSCD